jgi:hypothetical protein
MNKIHGDFLQTPPSVLMPVLPYLKTRWVVWECAAGEGSLVRGLTDAGFMVIGSDVDQGQDFLKWAPEKFDCVVTHPPHSELTRFLARAYELDKPFALLMPLHALDTPKRQALFRRGLELILLPERVCFYKPGMEKPLDQWILAWFTWRLRVGRQLTFYQGAVNIYPKNP